jgi:hypothetical protein
MALPEQVEALHEEGGESSTDKTLNMFEGFGHARAIYNDALHSGIRLGNNDPSSFVLSEVCCEVYRAR